MLKLGMILLDWRVIEEIVIVEVTPLITLLIQDLVGMIFIKLIGLQKIPL